MAKTPDNLSFEKVRPDVHFYVSKRGHVRRKGVWQPRCRLQRIQRVFSKTARVLALGSNTSYVVCDNSKNVLRTSVNNNNNNNNNKKYDTSRLKGMIISEQSTCEDMPAPQCYVICTFPFLFLLPRCEG